ncbi:F-BAR domain only protein 1 isoform X2 [Ahaetulla prasina]|uniref:F-BAR domain only protein 1 isoform X2 n=1 Tax=Ahaetulla prasina TaxID=499056 RepID=UPI00264A4C68|nr:F-BAR domain only protein 1 isoform X2 [Ahaetulla prasina]
MSYFAEHFWGEKNQGFDVLYHNMKHGQISAKELADFVRERAAVEEAYAKSMVKMSKMAGNSTQLGTFAPLWEVFRISSDKLALCHAELVKKLQDLIKEISRYGEEQLRAHRKSKDEVAGTLEAVQQLQGAAQHLPKAKEAFHSRCQELERLRREGASQKEMDKAELKSRKAVDALRRTVEKYNAARADFEQKMLDSAVRFQEVEESHLQHLKSLVGSYIHSVEDTHVQIGQEGPLPSPAQVQEEFKQNMENIGVETLLRNFAESKGTGCHPPGPLDLEELSVMSSSQEGKTQAQPQQSLPHSRTRAQGARAGLGPPEVDEEGFTVRPEMNQNGEHSSRFCSSSDSDYDDEDPPKFYIRIKPIQPPERVGSAATSAATEQLKASVGSLILPPCVGGTMKRHSSRHLKTFPSAAVVPTDTGPAPGAGERGGRPGSAVTPNLVPRMNSCDSKSKPEALPASALFGPPLESAFENEAFTAPRAYLLASSPSPFSSSSPENVEDSGLDSPPHLAMGPSPDSRLWSSRPATPLSPTGQRTPKGAITFRGSRGAILPEDRANPWLPQPSAPQDARFGAEPDWAGSGASWPPAGARAFSACSPDLFSSEAGLGGRRLWVSRPRSPAASDGAPRTGERDSCLSSNSASSSSSSPAPLSSGDSTSPSPWAPRGRDLDSRGPSASDASSEHTAFPPSAPHAWPHTAAPVRRTLSKRASAMSATSLGGETPRSFSPAPLSALTSSQSTSALTEPRGLFTASQQPPPPALGRSSLARRGGSVAGPSAWAEGSPSLFPSVPGVSRGPSPVVLGSQGALPVATAFTEYIHAYFKGQNADSCLVKVTGELTMSFPAGIIRVFSSAPAPPVLSFRLLHTAPIEQFLPNASLLFSDSSQSDPSSRDFWLNMAALTGHLQKQAEQSGAAPYYNVTLLRYQYSRQGQEWAPLQLSVSWECGSEATRVSVDYRYNASALASAVALTNVQVLLPIEEPVANVQPQPKACWNLEEKRLLWRLLDVPSTQGQGGSGRLLASWEPLDGPSRPTPVAAQFTSEGSTVSGADVELVGSGYRMSLVKKRFATGIYLAGS